MKNNQYTRFLKFVNWYMRNGGSPLTAEQIERTIIKF